MKDWMMNSAMLGISFFSGSKKAHEYFSNCLSQDKIFSCGMEFWRRLKRGFTCSGRWDIKKPQRNRQQPLQPFLHGQAWAFVELSVRPLECQGSVAPLSLDVFGQVLQGQLSRVLCRGFLHLVPGRPNPLTFQFPYHFLTLPSSLLHVC